MASNSDDLSIEDILARVRAKTAGDSAADATTPDNSPRRHALGTIPHLHDPDDGEIIALDKPLYTIEEFAALDDEDFLRNAYRIILGRPMDAAGRDYYLPALRQGHISVVRVLSALRRSAEGKARATKIRWLWPAAALDRFTTLPVVGKLFEPFMRFLVRSTTNQRLATLSARHRDLIADVNAAMTVVRRNQALSDVRLQTAEQDIHVRLMEAIDRSTNAHSELHALLHEISGQRAALGSVLEQAKTNLPPSATSAVEQVEQPGLDSLYVAFENKFRGSTRQIAQRMERYVPMFRASAPVAAGGTVLDIGCGRGEFLALLKRHNMATRGVDLNAAMVAQAKTLDLDVIEGDALAYLRSLPEASLAAITGFHIVEHIAFQDLVGLFDEAQRVLMPDGFVIFETPNPENLVVGACTFHYDPTHNRPLPPDYLAFIAQARGFGTTRIIRTDEDCDLTQPASGFEPTEINDWFRQPPDYALYAQKSQAGAVV